MKFLKFLLKILPYPFQKASGIEEQAHFWAWSKFALAYQRPKNEKGPEPENDQQILVSFRIL